MFYLSAESAKILAWDKTASGQSKNLDNLINDNQEILMTTGAKLKYNSKKAKYYLTSYHVSEYDVIALLYYIDASDDYFTSLLDSGKSPEFVEKRKACFASFNK